MVSGQSWDPSGADGKWYHIPPLRKLHPCLRFSGGRRKALNDDVLWKKKTSFVMTELTHIEGIVKSQGNSPLAVCMQTASLEALQANHFLFQRSACFFRHFGLLVYKNTFGTVGTG